MGLSVFLAEAFGIYFLVMGIAMLARREGFMRNVRAMLDSPGAMYLAGIMTLILGILLVVSHNIWVWHWAVIITILSWYVFIKGVALVWFPELGDKWRGIMANVKFLNITGVATIIIGIIFLILGFWG